MEAVTGFLLKYFVGHWTWERMPANIKKPFSIDEFTKMANIAIKRVVNEDEKYTGT